LFGKRRGKKAPEKKKPLASGGKKQRIKNSWKVVGVSSS